MQYIYLATRADEKYVCVKHRPHHCHGEMRLVMDINPFHHTGRSKPRFECAGCGETSDVFANPRGGVMPSPASCYHAAAV